MRRELNAVGALGALVAALAVAPLSALAAQHKAPQEPVSIDVRRTTLPRAPAPRRDRDARGRLKRTLGAEGIVSSDPVFGGARVVERTDGLLTPASPDSPEAITFRYVRAHRDVFGLSDDDLDALRLSLRALTPSGITNLEWTQTVDGIAAYDNTLSAAVTSAGQIVAIHGTTVAGLDVDSTKPQLSSSRARDLAAAEVGGLPSTSTATLTIFGAAKESRLAWRVLTTDAAQSLFDVVVDAMTGAILVRHSLTEALSRATVFERYPGSPVDGTGGPVDLAADPSWLDRMNTTAPASLRGNNAHAYSDSGGTNGFDSGEDIAPSSGTDWNFQLVPINGGPGCPIFGGLPGCTWDGTSAATNRAQATTQLFYYVNRFHDHLKGAPIGFTHASRNFELTDADGGGPGLGNDAVNAEADDEQFSSPATSPTRNNANMTTPPDGFPPRMQMFLFTNPALDGADLADIVYHEYTHGLTNRLIGNSAGLITHQAQSLGEAWSDWYALDFMVADGSVADTPADGDVLEGAYLYPGGSSVGGAPGVRTQALDCRPESTAPNCPGTAAAGPGGYTLGDLGKVNGTDIHAQGEIWVETLWDIRAELGSTAAERLITDALRLTPSNPSFLDARNAILAADQAQGSPHYLTLWEIFADRGMGFSASTASSSSTTAVEAFDMPALVAHAAVAVDDPPPLGDGDGIAEPGESVRLTETIRNPNPFTLTALSGVLSAATPGLVVGAHVAAWTNSVAAGATAAASTPFSATIPPDQTCGAPLSFALAMTTAQGTDELSFAVYTGGPGVLANASSSAPATTIPDNNASGVTSAVTSATPGLINDINVRITNITHTYDGDLVLRLIAPDNTSVLLANKRGGPGNDFTNTVFDDSAPFAISAGSPNSVPPFSANFRPEEPLAILRGKPAAGTWKLKVVDTAAADTGTLGAWDIDQRPALCSTTAPPPPVAASGETTDITPSGAILHGSVDPRGTPTEFAFQFGTTTLYGTMTAATSAGSGTGAAPVSLAISGLSPGTIYHARTVALRGATIVAVGADQTFTTAPAPPGSAASVPSKPGGTVGDLLALRGHVTFTRSPKTVFATKTGRFTYRFDATRRFAGKARFGSDRAIAAGPRARAKIRLSLGVKGFSATRASDRTTVTLRLTKKARGALKRLRVIRVRVIVTLDGRTFTSRFTLKPAKRPAAKARRRVRQ